METRILKPTRKNIIYASQLLKQGHVVGVPTETVYGLAGDCTNKDAIKKIFKAKGRPQDNPLIVHVSSFKMLDGIVSEIPAKAKKLMRHFWPGPLTIIMPKGSKVCDETCAGLDSVGVRMPSNKIARKIIKLSNTPFAAPSANISGRPSPTNANDVFADMNGKIEVILDGGDCKAGVESTVVSCLDDVPVILRPGVITKLQMEKVLKERVNLAKAITEGVCGDEKVLSPGMKYKHYSPNADVTIIKGDFVSFKKYVEENKKDGCFALVFDGEQKKLNLPCVCYGKEKNAKQQAHLLFSALRKLDKLGAKIVYARCPDSSGVALAVFNRLIRSAGFKIVDLC